MLNKNNGITMGLDTSTKTGVVVLGPTGDVLYQEEIEIKKLRGIDRVGAIAGSVMEIAFRYRPQVAVIENYGFANAHTLVPLVEIGTAVRYFLYQEGFPYVTVPPTSLKKFITGVGNCSKDKIMLRVFQRWAFEAKTNNIADAFGLAMFGAACIGREFSLDSMRSVHKVLENSDNVIGQVPDLIIPDQ